MHGINIGIKGTKAEKGKALAGVRALKIVDVEDNFSEEPAMMG